MRLYAVDTSRLSLQEFCFRSHASNTLLGARGKFRDVVDAFRTIYWFHDLRIWAHAKGPNDLQERLEPEASGFGQESGLPYRRNKWRYYRKGSHTPRPDFVSEIKRRCSGYATDFDHILWDALRTEMPIASYADHWIRRLEPRVQTLFWQKEDSRDASRIRFQKFDKRQLAMLERRAGLDALACLTMMLREAHERGDEEYAYELGQRACRMLVMIGDTLHAHGIAEPFHEFYELAILPLAAFRGMRPTLAGISFMELVGHLSHRMYHLHQVDAWSLSLEAYRAYQQKIISGDYWFDYLHLLNPIPIPVDPSLPPDNPLYRSWQAENALRLWALNAVRTFSREKFPPDDLYREAMIAYREVKQYQRRGQR